MRALEILLACGILMLFTSCQQSKSNERSNTDSIEKEETPSSEYPEVASGEDASGDVEPAKLTAEQLLAAKEKFSKEKLIYDNYKLVLSYKYEKDKCSYNCLTLGKKKSDSKFYESIASWDNVEDAHRFFSIAYSIFPTSVYAEINLNDESNQIDAMNADFQRKYFISELNKDAYYAINSPSGIKYLGLPYGYSQRIGSSRMTNKVYYLPKNVVYDIMKTLETNK